jgi:hypothetical protein
MRKSRPLKREAPHFHVIPAKAGIHGLRVPLESVLKQGLYSIRVSPWILAFARMTFKKNFWCKALLRGGALD